MDVLVVQRVWRRGQIDVGLIERQRLDEWRLLAEPRHDQLACLAICGESAAEKRGVWTQGARFDRPHRRAHAKRTGLVRRGGDDTARADAADNDRLAAERRLVPLLNGSEERVQV